MNRIRLAAIILGFMLLTVFFHNIYVCSVRDEILEQITPLLQSAGDFQSPDQALQTWKNRKGLLALTTPLTVLDQIDFQFVQMQASIQTRDVHGYACACRHLQSLLSVLGR